MSLINNINFPILILSNNTNKIRTEGRLKDLTEALSLKKYQCLQADTDETALALAKRESGLGCAIIHEDEAINSAKNALFIKTLIRIIRMKNENVPIFFSSDTSLSGRLPIDFIREIHESFNINDDTVSFIAGRIDLAIRLYIKNMLPPYFAALKNFAVDSPYYWDCPGHQGGVAYLKHPVGREFINFFGENLMRADIGISTPEMGDWLEHKGAPAESEKRAAKLFGADKTFYVTGGSSQSNQIVGHSLDLKDKIVLTDRNCHKSVNHELTVTQAVPVYFRPSRNGLGIIGLISPDQFDASAMCRKIKESILTGQLKDQEPAYAIITNCTYDGLIYDVTRITRELGMLVPRIKFDEAWYAYARFHPLYKGRFAMGVPVDRENGPTLYAVQSTHKMLAALSSASMIHIRHSSRAPVNYDVFNQAFMMHGTTSPFYPVIASIDVATAMMEGEAGKAFVNEAIEDAIHFRKNLVSLTKGLKEENPSDWFFNIWQPDTLMHKGKEIPFTQIPDEVLTVEPSCWVLHAGDAWHGFDDLPENYAMLDPIKVTITCPGVDIDGNIETFGIPAPVVAKYLDTQRIVPAKNSDYTILILFALGSTPGKWNTLIDMLMLFKHHHDVNTPLISILPDIAESAPGYITMGLGDLCRAIHKENVRLRITELSERACSAEAVPVMSPSEAYQWMVAGKTELVRVSQIMNRTLAVMITPYPPGIPLIMPGEKVTPESQVIVDYLVALECFGQRFPGFEHELQGVEVDEHGAYWVRCLIEDRPLRLNLLM